MRPLSFLIFILFAMSLIVPVNAIQYTPGVHQGQRAQYQISGTLSENVTSSTLTITQISNSNVTVRSTDIYKDGNMSSEFLWVDLSTGQNNTLQSNEPGFFFAILPGRSKGDSVYGSSSSLLIQNSFVKQYAGAYRQTNFANITLSGIGSTSYYWDAQTGIFTEILKMTRDSAQRLQVAVHALLNATDMWSPQTQNNSENNLGLFVPELAGIGIIVVLAFLLGYFRVTKRRRARKMKR